jgi:DNA-binding NarL/FixJ family response regulator
MKPQIRILLVDDHSLFRESLSRLLEAEPDFRIAATCATVEDALAALDRHPVDVVLLDYVLGWPAQYGNSATRWIWPAISEPMRASSTPL